MDKLEVISPQIKQAIQLNENELNSSLAEIMTYADDLSLVTKQFSESYKNYLKNEVEQKEIIKSVKSGYTNTAGLPGVFAGTLGNYNMDEVQKRNERLSQLLAAKEPLEKQSEQLWRFMVANLKSIQASLASINQCRQSIAGLLETIED